MYCPNCAASIDGVKFCRSCGTNVSLVPQALSGQLPEAAPRDSGRLHRQRRELRRREREQKPASLEGAVTTFFVGIGFVLAAYAVMRYVPAGRMWGWSFLIPAFSCIGSGLGQFLKWHSQWHQQRNLQSATGQSFNSPSGQRPSIQSNPADLANPESPQISAPTTSELKVPPSVTEHTTKHLERK